MLAMALVADWVLSSWFLRLSGFFGCYQSLVVNDDETDQKFAGVGVLIN